MRIKSAVALLLSALLCATGCAGQEPAVQPVIQDLRQEDGVLANGYTLIEPSEGAQEAETPPEITNSYLLMQRENSSYILSGETGSFVSAAGEPLHPMNWYGATMLPLRGLAEAFGWELAWDGENRRTILTGGGNVCCFYEGQTAMEKNGELIECPFAPALLDGVTYISLEMACAAFGCWGHSYAPEEGDFVLLSQYPVSEDDVSSGAGLKPDVIGNDSVYRWIGLEKLGPSRAMLDSASVYFRCNSAYFVKDGVEMQMDEGSAAPYIEDGYAMMPLETIALVFGCEMSAGPGGCSLVREGRSAVFPFGTGLIGVNGSTMENSDYRVIEKDGVIYASVRAVSDGLGLQCTIFPSVKGVVYSSYKIEDYKQLMDYAESLCALLPTASPYAKGYIALTFDDGPSGKLTHRLLDGLKERGAHATFFLCDYRIQAYSSCMSRYAAEGHETGNHSATHTALDSLSGAALDAQIDNTNSSIEKYGGTKVKLMRPPEGAWDQEVLDELAERGMSCIMWNIDPLDWLWLNEETTVEHILSNVGDGDIILLHDLYATSVDAALAVVDALKAEGYEFVTISELAEIKGVELEPGGVYYGF